MAARPLALGLDVGSTTVKVVVVEPGSREILWSRYARHDTRQAPKLRELLIEADRDLGGLAGRPARLLLTGSGAAPLVPALSGRFVQEVNAVTLAVETLHADAGSIIELGGQDAKIVIYTVDPRSGQRHATPSMNDKCASGTGATIDKCVIKVGLAPEAVTQLRFSAERLHHVAAKCGVFAETDIVNLIKSGIPATEVLCSLGDAIVMQNLSVLTRGNTLRHKVILLGGPNSYLPWLQDCWRLRIPQSWEERGHEWPRDRPVEDLVVVPENASLYAAYGAVLQGLEEGGEFLPFAGIEALERFIAGGRSAALRAAAAPGLVASDREGEEFQRDWSVPPFTPASFPPGATIRGYLGIDGGSTSSKAVLVGEDRAVLAKAYRLSKGNPIDDVRALALELTGWAEGQGCRLEALGLGVTGYAAAVLRETLLADADVVETVAHMAAAVHYFPDADVVCDIGGQDIKVLLLERGQVRDFRLSNQCSAGNGMLLQAMAAQLGVPLESYAAEAFRARLAPPFSYGCAVFLDADRVNFQKEGYAREELLAGLAAVLPKNVWQYVVQVPRLAELGRVFVLQGGTQRNLAALKAQVDYIRSRVPGGRVHLHPHTGEAGAIGAAFEALRSVSRTGRSSFVGLEATLGLTYTTRNDEETRCRFCPNLCARTFIDARRPDGGKSRYIAGFSCEKGTVESKDRLLEITNRRRSLKERFPNLVEAEARLAFRRILEPPALPAAGSPVDDVEVRRGLLGIRRRPLRRGFRRSDAAAAARRAGLRIGLPRVLNLYTVGPFLRAYFETLGIPERQVVFSDPTGEEMWLEGGKYGSVDPCFPAKVTQAHIHDLLFHHHPKGALDYLYFPCITHMPTWLTHTMDSASCPVVAGTPKVVAAAFTKEKDFFAERGIEYVDAALQFTERSYLRKQLFETWGARLGVTEDESDFACAAGWRAQGAFEAELERRGREVLDEVEGRGGIAVLALCRPYHHDPGLNHGIFDELQGLGYPILGIRSLPRDEAWLRRFFGPDIEQGHIRDPFDIADVWPENYSTNSTQKVWAAKLAARHPNLVVVDLSSFKCGHDAPTYGLIDRIIKAGGTPYQALHDIDANKPSGSIQIRVQTYAHALQRHVERLAEREARKSELVRAVEARRRELVKERLEAMTRAIAGDPERAAEGGRVAAAFAAALAEDAAPRGFRAEEVEEIARRESA